MSRLGWPDADMESMEEELGYVVSENMMVESAEFSPEDDLSMEDDFTREDTDSTRERTESISDEDDSDDSDRKLSSWRRPYHHRMKKGYRKVRIHVE